MKQPLRDAVVVVTGASSGIGLTIAHAFAREGCRLVLTARRRNPLERAAESCEALGGRALAVPADVTEPEAMPAVARAAIAAFGGIDVWVNNAGESLWGAFQDIPVATHARLLELNLLGAIHGTHAVLPHFLERERGVLINIVSFGGWVPMPWASTYSATKFGLRGLTESLRHELADRPGIQVCGVYPGFVDTPTFIHSGNYSGHELRPVPPVSDPAEVARAVVGLTLRPRRSVGVGLAPKLAIPYAIAPELTGRLMARFGARFFRAGRPAPDTDGLLFEPMEQGVSERGGWRTRPRVGRGRVMALGLLAGAAALAFSASSHSRRIGRRR